MPRTLEASAPAKEPQLDGSVRAAQEEPAAAASGPVPVPEFDVAAHHEEIAKVAYRIWLERAYCPGSPEEDWLKAVNEVRAKYTRTGF
jgi:hypothetical protein